MFTVGTAAAAAVCQAFDEGVGLAGAIEFGLHFPLVGSALARDCVRQIAGWRLPPEFVQRRE